MSCGSLYMKRGVSSLGRRTVTNNLIMGQPWYKLQNRRLCLRLRSGKQALRFVSMPTCPLGWTFYVPLRTLFFISHTANNRQRSSEWEPAKPQAINGISWPNLDEPKTRMEGRDRGTRGEILGRLGHSSPGAVGSCRSTDAQDSHLPNQGSPDFIIVYVSGRRQKHARRARATPNTCYNHHHHHHFHFFLLLPPHLA